MSENLNRKKCCKPVLPFPHPRTCTDDNDHRVDVESWFKLMAIMKNLMMVTMMTMMMVMMVMMVIIRTGPFPSSYFIMIMMMMLGNFVSSRLPCNYERQ